MTTINGMRVKPLEWQNIGRCAGRQADAVAIIRTFWWVIHVVTCFFIIAHNGHNLGYW